MRAEKWVTKMGNNSQEEHLAAIVLRCISPLLFIRVMPQGIGDNSGHHLIDGC